MSPYDVSAWGEFGLALVSAASTLLGLVFVAISINLREILSRSGLIGRAGEGLFILLVVLVAAALLVVPGQGQQALGIEWIALGAATAITLAWVHARVIPLYATMRRVLVGRIVAHQAVALAFVIAGVATASSAAGGMYWFALAAIGGVVVGVVDAWVLLVEILR